MPDFGKAPPATTLPRFNNTQYDKDAEDVGDFDARAQAAKPAKGSGGRREYFDEWKPDQTLTPVIFHEGKYLNALLMKEPNGTMRVEEKILPFKRIVDHFNKNAPKGAPKSCVCSAVPFHEEREDCKKRCSGCARFANGFQKNPVTKKWEQKGDTSKQEKRCFSIGRAQVMVAEDSDRKDKNGNPYKNWVPENRQNPAHKNLDKVNGRRYVYGATMTQYYQIMGGAPGMAPGTSIKDKVAKNCAGCGSIDSIRLVAVSCPHCEYPHESVQDDATDEEIRLMGDLTKTPRACPGCGKTDRPVKTFSCSNPNCTNPRSARIFDGICWLRGVPNKASDSGPVSYSVTLERWTPLPANHNWQDILAPIDLDTVKAPAPPELQERVFGARPANAPAPELTPGADPYDDGGAPAGNNDMPF